MNNNGLGRGLSSLIPPKQNNQNNASHEAQDLAPEEEVRIPPARSSVAAGDNVLKIEIGKIKENPLQPRSQFEDKHMDDLVASIKEHGVIQPLVVTEKDGQYELIAGERRLRASRRAGLATVPAIVREAGDREKLELALIENLQRENLNPMETAAAYRRLMDEFKLTQEEVAHQVGKSRSSVANTLRMMNLPEEIQLALIDGRITEGHAKYLLGLESRDKQMALFRKILHHNLSVKDTNKEVKKMGGTKRARIRINYADKDKEFAFREFFGAKTEIRRKGKGGQVIIDFFSEDELIGIVDKIK